MVIIGVDMLSGLTQLLLKSSHLLFLALLGRLLTVYPVHLVFGVHVILRILCIILSEFTDGRIAIATDKVVLHLRILVKQSVALRVWHSRVDAVRHHTRVSGRPCKHLTGEVGYRHDGYEQYQREPVFPLLEINFSEIYLHDSF